MPRALEVKYIPKGLIKVSKYNLTNIFIKDSIVIVILIVILIIGIFIYIIYFFY
jgi:flagellar basal body-associated protein FliL